MSHSVDNCLLKPVRTTIPGKHHLNVQNQPLGMKYCELAVGCFALHKGGNNIIIIYITYIMTNMNVIKNLSKDTHQITHSCY